MRRTLLALVIATGLLVAGCGSEDSPTTSGSSTTEKPLTKCASKVDDVTVTGEQGSAPKITFDTPFSVKRSSCEVLIAGTGKGAEEGDTVIFGFTFVNGRTGKVYGSSYETGDTASVVLNDQLLRGVRQGLLGAKAGGRVVVAIAPDDGYGLKGGDAANGLEKDDTLVFVADIDQIRHPLDRAEGDAVAPVDGLPTVVLDDNGKPTITVPKTTAPTELVTQLLIEGTGDVVATGQTITVHYTGVLWATGQQFDSSWDRKTPTNFVIGTGAVISGWDKGLVGQKVGSQVLLVVPPAEGYKEAGAPNAGISGTDTLVFVVDILDSH